MTNRPFLRIVDNFVRKGHVEPRKAGNKIRSARTDDVGRFPFNQKFRAFRVGKRMEQKFPGIKFRNFGTTSRGCPKIPKNRNNRKIPFHSTIPAWARLLRAGIKGAGIVKMASQHSARRVCLSPKAYSSYSSMNDCSFRSVTKWYPSCEHGLASKQLAHFSRASKVTLDSSGKYAGIV